eukprot:scaffold80861_cov29-Tisochrysis_lutea.AAC.4
MSGPPAPQARTSPAKMSPAIALAEANSKSVRWAREPLPGMLSHDITVNGLMPRRTRIARAA